MGAPIRAALPVNEDDKMTTGERRYSDHDLKTAERIGGVEAILRDHVLPALERIEANCREARCFVQSLPVAAPPPSPIASPAPVPIVSSPTWFWGKVAGLVAAILATVTTIGVAIVQKAPEILAAISAFFNPPAKP